MRCGHQDDDDDAAGWSGQRWTGLTMTADRRRGGACRRGGGGGGGGEGLIAREIREQRDRERQLIIQRQQLLTRPDDVTSPRSDDVTETSASLGDPETEMPRDSDVTVDGQLGRSRVTRESTEPDEPLQKVFAAVLFSDFASVFHF